MTLNLIEERLVEIAHSLRGTNKSLEDGLAAFNLSTSGLTKEVLEHLETIVFRCKSCNWWYDIVDLEDGDVCYGCMDLSLDVSPDDYPLIQFYDI